MFFRLCCVLTLLALAGCGGGSEPIAPSASANTASAVAFTQDLQRYGYCYDVSDANLCAEKYCFEGSGQACATQFSSADLGHYALALGANGWGIGFSPSDRGAADASAMDQCWQRTQGCRVVETWQADGIR
jgi:hypothetical protein